MPKLLSHKVTKVKVDHLTDLPDYSEEKKRTDARFCHDCPFGDLTNPATWRIWQINHFGQTVRMVYVCDNHKALYSENPKE